MRNPTAAVVIIGNEVLSGRTLDINTQYIATKLTERGIDLVETRTIPDNKQVIISTILELKDKYDYIFTTGGIGPTHDDITSDAIAKAFGVPLVLDAEAYRMLSEGYKAKEQEMNEPRKKMAYLPQGSRLIPNSVSIAPGFIVENVYVLAGVPHIMHAMMEYLLPTLQCGKVVKSLNLDIMVGESLIAEELEALQHRYLAVDMGSYPFEIEGKHGTSLVLRSSDYDSLNAAYAELQKLVAPFC